MNQRVSYALRVVVGAVFVLSGLLKAIDASAFANLISDYGLLRLGLVAPLIIAAEVILGVLLIFNIRPRRVAATTLAFILLVSAVYLYGVLARGITNCGCFGPLTWLNTKPWLTFTRNAVLVGLLIPSLCKPQQGVRLTMPSLVFMAAITVVIMFMCGFSFRMANCLKKSARAFEAYPVEKSGLTEHITFSADSTYLVFAFSYGCPYCLNSIGNVNQYQPMGAVDRVIGLAVRDSVARERFDSLFDVNFEIQEISNLEMYRMVNTLPTAFIIRNDSVVSKVADMVITPALLKR